MKQVKKETEHFMKTPKTSKHFKKIVDVKSGAAHYVLSTRLAEYQQGFYFINNSMTNDGRYLWFHATPNAVYSPRDRNLGYVDFLTDEVVICYDSIAEGASPYVDAETGEVYFARGKSLYKRAPGKDKKAEKIYTLKEYPGYVNSIVCHLTRLSDKKSFFLDIGRDDFGFIQGVVNIETGEFTKWTEMTYTANHGQINPANDRLAMVGIDSGDDLNTGRVFGVPISDEGVFQRIWTVTADGEKTCIPPLHNYASHEWWSPNGKRIYYCCDNHGICYYDITNGDHVLFHECDPWHAHTTMDERYFVYDVKMLERYGGKWYRGCPAAVKFLNRETGKLINIVTEMPEGGTPEKPNCYHIDPHPRFTDNEKYIVFTTTELGSVDLAVAFVDELIELSK